MDPVVDPVVNPLVGFVVDPFQAEREMTMLSREIGTSFVEIKTGLEEI